MIKTKIILLFIIFISVDVFAGIIDTFSDTEKLHYYLNILNTDSNILFSLNEKKSKIQNILKDLRSSYKPYLTAKDINRPIIDRLDILPNRQYHPIDRIEYVTRTKYNFGCCGPTLTGILSGMIAYFKSGYLTTIGITYLNFNLLMYVYTNSTENKPEGCLKFWEFPPVKFYTEAQKIGTDKNAPLYNEQTRQMLINKNLNINTFNAQTLEMLQEKNKPLKAFNKIIDTQIYNIISTDLNPVRASISKYESEIDDIKDNIEILKTKLMIK